jgi:hypothetical protein
MHEADYPDALIADLGAIADAIDAEATQFRFIDDNGARFG